MGVFAALGEPGRGGRAGRRAGHQAPSCAPRMPPASLQPCSVRFMTPTSMGTGACTIQLACAAPAHTNRGSKQQHPREAGWGGGVPGGGTASSDRALRGGHLDEPAGREPQSLLRPLTRQRHLQLAQRQRLLAAREEDVPATAGQQGGVANGLRCRPPAAPGAMAHTHTAAAASLTLVQQTGRCQPCTHPFSAPSCHRAPLQAPRQQAGGGGRAAAQPGRRARVQASAGAVQDGLGGSSAGLLPGKADPHPLGSAGCRRWGRGGQQARSSASLCGRRNCAIAGCSGCRQPSAMHSCSASSLGKLAGEAGAGGRLVRQAGAVGLRQRGHYCGILQAGGKGTRAVFCCRSRARQVGGGAVVCRWWVRWAAQASPSEPARLAVAAGAQLNAKPTCV